MRTPTWNGFVAKVTPRRKTSLSLRLVNAGPAPEVPDLASTTTVPADPTSWLSRTVQRMAAHPRFARVAPSVVPRLDRFLYRISGGRILSSSAIVPSIVLVTTGAKSGQQRGPCPLFLTLDAAANRGLDFVVFTEHNTHSHVRELTALQPYFDAEFPHGVDQYISAAATNWATMALALARE